MSVTEEDRKFLARAIALAEEKSREREGGPFGAVVVKDGVVIAEGWNRVSSCCDPTAHAEVEAIRKAGAALKAFHLMGCVLYTSCEPCPMCLAAAYWAHVERIVYAADRYRAAKSGFDDAFIYEELALPVEGRRVPLVQGLRDEGDGPFERWDALVNKIPY